jgi:phage terminase large subunit
MSGMASRTDWTGRTSATGGTGGTGRSGEQGMLAMLTLAQVSGCPADQMRRFLSAGYVPHRRGLDFHAAARRADRPTGPQLVALGGARGGGKSHASFAQLLLDDCQRAAGVKGLFLRKIGKAARESFEDLRLRVLTRTAHQYKRQEGVVEFPNGSRVVLGHFKDERDIDNYLGIEYDVIVLEEATTLTWEKFTRLRGSLRSSRPDWRPRMYLTTNPGGVGHAWFKRVFVEPYRFQRQGETRFIPATVDDNPTVNPEYRQYLDGLTGWLKRAWRYGDWDIAAGQFFTTWRADVHVEAPLERAPAHWRYWMALDYGFTHYTAAYLFGQDGDGMIHTLAEHAERRWLPERHAQAIHAMLARLELTTRDLYQFVAGADVFSKGKDGRSVAEQYEEHGIYLSQANDDRISGAAQVLRMLGDVDAGIGPRVLVASTCARLIECLPALEHDPHRPEDVLKVDVDDNGLGGDDAYDAWRYGLMAVASDDRVWVY